MTVPRQVSHWVGNATLHNRANSVLVNTDPRTGEPTSAVALGGAVDVDAAVASARLAQRGWASRPPVDRGRMLAAIGVAIRERRDEFVELECAETGKLDGEGRTSIETAADYFEYYAGIVRAHFGETIDLGSGEHAFTRNEPWGVVGMITPWNGPLSQAARGIAPALAVGNTVVIKPSEFTPSTTVLLARLASTLGLPPGVLNVVTGEGGDVGSRLVAHPDVRMIAFTGSVASGRVVARAAGDRLVPVTLELGGKSPNIVFADADMERAATGAATVCVAAGQQCAALSRLLVEASIYEPFLAAVAERVAARVPGAGLGPLTTRAQHEKVIGYFAAAREDGARLVTGGRAAEEGALARGRYVHPTVYADVTPQMRIFREEIFGPVLAVSRFDGEDEAVALANDSDFGLVAAVWTSDSARALRVAGRLEAGQVIVNGGAAGIETPFGGYKCSGIGREKGFAALSTYTQLKTTVVSLAP
ncbi:aldehyde dehydrogenase family protein [Jatrophihabitans sp.]|uniref:aldehyde dehydrogenase family protein n=1 Tax=Jatrophihabitans sp. TaxID=1932789 RepID=UPI0030C77762|nr:Aldehyde Dehydrogenase [Jatrophihabitans sp.]